MAIDVKTNGVSEGVDLRANSRTLYEGNSRAGARAMMKAIGFDDDDLRKPIIGIANTWIETMPCNFGLRKLAEEVEKPLGGQTFGRIVILLAGIGVLVVAALVVLAIMALTGSFDAEFLDPVI